MVSVTQKEVAEMMAVSREKKKEKRLKGILKEKCLSNRGPLWGL